MQHLKESVRKIDFDNGARTRLPKEFQQSKLKTVEVSVYVVAVIIVISLVVIENDLRKKICFGAI